MMPFSTISGESCGWEDALFTVTSASCVTGLVVQDTAEYWSPFGQVIILLCIQIGGLGVMMTTAALLLTTRRKITVSERMLIGQSISIDEISGVVRLARGVLIGTMAIEGVGAVILTLRFSRQFPFWDSLWKGIFHSVSAFCNAGFDLMGNNYEGLSSYVGDFTVSMTIAFLIIIGGLGFYVWNDVRAYKTKKKLSIHTKIVLFTTAALLVFGTIGFMVLEWNNPATIGNEGFGSKLIASFFQSTTTRTAGFDQMIQANMTPGSQALSCLLMFVGGSPGSTAGGIKTTTLIVILFTAISAMRGKSSTVVLQRT
ncbi:MAG: potassium transporter TrkG, partial [Angelakisella sp.]